MSCTTSFSENYMNSSLLCLVFEWNLEDFSRNHSGKDVITEKNIYIYSEYLGNNDCFPSILIFFF